MRRKPVPTASNLNVDRMTIRANLTVVALDGTGQVCIFTSVTTHVVVDSGRLVPGRREVRSPPMAPVRVIDSRSSGPVRDLAVGLSRRGAD